ncbi:MAG: outer membrane protein assembly factor BamA [Chlorobiaceae bacterium]|nr:outer membrane protein assembly factor BamA [Chlorobiaceae bacterium]
MKKTRKLITLVLLALALNTLENTAEAKNRPSNAGRQSAASAEQTESTDAKKEVFSVTSISFSGLETLNEKEITASLPLKVNDQIAIPGPQLTAAMQYLWQLQLFSDISVQQTDPAGKNIALNFTVKELPILDKVTFEGNKKLDNDEVRRKAGLVAGKRITQQELLTASNKIEKLYASKGYLTAGAEFHLQDNGKNHVIALFSITEGSKVSIEKITFHGNNAFDQNKLRGVFNETHQNSWWRKIFGSPKLDTDKFNDDKNLLVEFYRNNGYRDARVLRDAISYTDDKKGLLLDIYLDEGQKYYIGNVTWTGNTKDFATTELLNTTFKIKKGDVYNAKLIQERLNFSQDNGDVSSLYLDRGYLSFKAKLEETVVKPDAVDLKINMVEGEPFQLNTISIKGNTKTKDHVIRRELYTVPGDMFSRQNVVRSIRELSMLNYFDPEQITPDIQPNPENNTVDLTYNVIEKQTDTFNTSVGYSSTGFIGSLGLTFSNFSLKDIFNREAYQPLPHGDGQKLGFQWQFGSSNYNTISLSYTEPWAFGTPTAVGFSVFDTHSAYIYNSDGVTPTIMDQYGTTLSVGRRLTWPDDYFSVNWKLKYLHTNGGLLSLYASQVNAPSQADEYSITQTITRNSIDSPIYPRRGSKNSISGELAGGPLPGTVDFYKITGSSSWFFPITRSLVWNISTQHGYLGTFTNNDYIPYTDFFYMGGSGMSTLPTVPLRGYNDRSLGYNLYPGDPSSTLYGGKIYSKFTSELRYPLTMSQSVSIYALAFVEAGDLWMNSKSVNYGDLKKSAGLGLRLYLPIIGQIGLDYGYGFNAVDSIPNKKQQGFSFTFSFGGAND